MSCSEDVAVDMWTQDQRTFPYIDTHDDEEALRQAAQPPAPGQLLPWLLLVAEWARGVRHE